MIFPLKCMLKWHGVVIKKQTRPDLTWLSCKTKDFSLCPGVRDSWNSASDCSNGMDRWTRPLDATKTSKNNSTSTFQLECSESGHRERQKHMDKNTEERGFCILCWFVLLLYYCLKPLLLYANMCVYHILDLWYNWEPLKCWRLPGELPSRCPEWGKMDPSPS